MSGAPPPHEPISDSTRRMNDVWYRFLSKFQVVTDFALTFLSETDVEGMRGALQVADYEDDSYTPTAAFGGDDTGITYDAQIGSFTRTGLTVTAHAHVVLTSNGSGVGNLSISLPFEADTEGLGTAVVWASDGALADTPVVCYVDAGDSFVNFVFQSGAGTDRVDDTMIGDLADIGFSITYTMGD